MAALRRAAPWLVAAAAALALPAHALFDDDEARKAIVDLRARVDANDEQAKVRATELAAVNAQLLEQLTALRRSLLDLNNQLETVRGELARLRGDDERIARQLAEVQRAHKDAGQALDDRLRRLEPLKVSLDGSEFSVEPAEKAAYDEAIAAIRGGEFDKSVALLGAFQRRYPGSPYGDSVRFWLGNAMYGKRDYKEAITAFRGFVAAAPAHPRAPEALLALANSQVEMKDPRAARATLDELLKAYPDSEAAQAGRQRLAALPPAAPATTRR